VQISLDAEDALVREYQITAELFMNESRISWELVSMWIVLQGGLISAVVLLHSVHATWGSSGYLILFSAGTVSSFAWGLMQYRAKMWRDNWLLFGLRLERQLKERNIPLQIFGFEHLVREKKKVLELFDDEIRERNLRLQERFGALKLPHGAMFVLAVVWFILILASFLVKF
jgi:hypothetical protein